MASNQFGPGDAYRRSAQDIKNAQNAAKAADAKRAAAASAAGRGRRSIGGR